LPLFIQLCLSSNSASGELGGLRGSSIGSANYRLKLNSQKSRAHTALQRDPLLAGGDRVQLAVISALQSDRMIARSP
jgi:hypothetical protein